MFVRRCRLLIKRIYNSFVMFKEDQIAAAQIAQIFGSELLKVQNSAQTDSGQTPNIVNLNPKSFLVGEQTMTNQRKAEEQHLIQMLQREAEASCPLPQEQTYTPQTVQATLPPQSASIGNRGLESQHGGGGSSPQIVAPLSLQQNHFLERIANSLERIANVVDKVEIKSKKKTIKRNKPKTSNPLILNETTA